MARSRGPFVVVASGVSSRVCASTAVILTLLDTAPSPRASSDTPRGQGRLRED